MKQNVPETDSSSWWSQNSEAKEKEKQQLQSRQMALEAARRQKKSDGTSGDD